VRPDPERLRGLSLFSSLSPEECEKLCGWCEERKVDEGRVLAAEGASGYMFFVVEEGTAEVTRDSVHVAELGPGDHFGEIAILDGGRRTATVTATSPMKVWAIFGTEFRRMEQEMPVCADLIKSAMSARLANG
jgi:CRP-like cAMP-binding protein